MPTETPWNAGRLGRLTGRKEVLFGRVYEDAAIESAVFPAETRIFCIASAGCTAIRLSVGRNVTAVDINPAQLDYARRRASGEAMQAGVVENRMALARRFLPLAGWTRPRLDEFLELDDPARQIGFWNQRLNTRRFRWALDVLLSTIVLRVGYQASLLHALPPRFSQVLRSRMERCWKVHPNRANGFARALLAAEDASPEKNENERPIRFVWAEAAAFLESCPPGSFDGFALSNVLDGSTPAYRNRLEAAVQRAGSPGSVMVRRSFSEPGDGAGPNLAAQDRSFLWGVVEALPTGS